MEQTKKRSTLKIVLITLGIIIALIIIVIGAFAFWAYREINSFNANDKSVVMADVDQFISYINQDKLSEAAALADPQYISLDAITGNLSQLQPIFKGYEREDSNFLNYKVDQFASGKVVTYKTTAYFSDNTQGTLEVIAAQENGVWKLQSINILASPSHLNGDIVETGDKVDPALLKTIISAIQSGNSIYTSGNPTAIRKEMILSAPSNAQQVTAMSDLDIEKADVQQIKNIDLIGTSTAIYSNHNTVWDFNKAKTSVLIELPITATTTGGQVGNVGLQGAYSNGQWYF